MAAQGARAWKVADEGPAGAGEACCRTSAGSAGPSRWWVPPPRRTKEVLIAVLRGTRRFKEPAALFGCLARRTDDALRRLTPEHRAILTFRHVNRLTEEEVRPTELSA